MNEASSKYVDRIATEKLINEKLSLVHHTPKGMHEDADASFDDFSDLVVQDLPADQAVLEQKEMLVIPSWVHTGYVENDMIRCHRYPCEKPAGELIFLHGLYEDNLEIYNFFFHLLNEGGYSVTLMQLPYHYERKPAVSSFSGEYFWSADLGRSALAYKQAVYDAYRLYRMIQTITGKRACLVGFSMGGGIGLTLASLYPLAGLFVINPVCNISKLTWNSSLFSPIRHDLETYGIHFEALKERYQPYEPLGAPKITTNQERISLAISLYDQINDLENYELLARSWKIPTVHPYKAGHLNILRVPRLAEDVIAFAGERMAK